MNKSNLLERDIPTRKRITFDHQMKIETINDRNKTILKNCVKSLTMSTAVGNDIIMNLETQDEQFDIIKKNLSEIEDNLSISKRTIRGMASWWGAFLNLITPSFVSSKKNKSLGNIDLDEVDMISAKSIVSSSTSNSISSNNEEEEYLDEINNLLIGLKNQNQVISSQLSLHNSKLEDIDIVVTSSTSNVQDLTKKIKSI